MKKQKRVNATFIRKELIPFMLREQGRGFEMSFWNRVYSGNKIYYSYDMGHDVGVPACNTVACLGGSSEVILCKAWNRPHVTESAIAAHLGLTNSEADGLFYNWRPTSEKHYRWPRAYALAFEKANTKLAKAKVAASLLRHVIATDARCLKARKFTAEN